MKNLVKCPRCGGAGLVPIKTDDNPHGETLTGAIKRLIEDLGWVSGAMRRSTRFSIQVLYGLGNSYYSADIKIDPGKRKWRWDEINEALWAKAKKVLTRRIKQKSKKPKKLD